MDRLWRRIAEAVMEPRFGELLDDLNDVRSLGGLSGESYVDKDLRTLLNRKVRGRFNLSYCGEGRPRSVPRLALGSGRRRRRQPRGRVRRPAGELARGGEHDRLRTGAVADAVPDHQPADLPAGPRAAAPALSERRRPLRSSRAPGRGRRRRA